MTKSCTRLLTAGFAISLFASACGGQVERGNDESSGGSGGNPGTLGVGGTGRAGSASAGAAGRGGTGTGTAGRAGSAGKAGSGGTTGIGGIGGSTGKGGSFGVGGSQACPNGLLVGKSCARIRSEFTLSTCDLCLTSTCCAELETCFGNASCAGLNDCLSERCFNEPDRIACGERLCGACLIDPSVRGMQRALRTCAETRCASECGTGPIDAGAPDGGSRATAFCGEYQRVCAFSAETYPNMDACRPAFNGFTESRKSCVEQHLGFAAASTGAERTVHCGHAAGRGTSPATCGP